MKKLRRTFERFCMRNRDKGIPNLMTWVCIATGIVFVINNIDRSGALFYWLYFDPNLIMQGQVWRLITYPLVYNAGDVFFTILFLLCYSSLGQAIENVWGTFRFNLFYFSGILLTDIVFLFLGSYADATYVNLSLFLAYATLYPNAQFLIMFIIPVKAWVLAVIDLLMLLIGIFDGFPMGLLPVVALGNYFLFFGKDFVRVFPDSWRLNASRAAKKAKNPKTIPFHVTGSHQAPQPKVPYNHKCTVCGRTDVDSPELEFRYCSRCKGYHCYCQEHISNHAHITE